MSDLKKLALDILAQPGTEESEVKTDSLENFELAEVQSKIGKIISIEPVSAPKAVGELILLRAQTEKGPKTFKAKYLGTLAKRHTPAASLTSTAQSYVPISATTPYGSTADEFATLARAAYMISYKAALRDGGPADFYAQELQHDKWTLAVKVRPLVAASPFPSTDTVGRLLHVRNLIAKHLAPAFAVMPAVLKIVGMEGTKERFESDPELRRTFMGELNLYLAYTCSQGGVAAHAARLEQAVAKTRPVFQNGKWIVAEISAFHKEWLASEALQSEFPSPECYHAYREKVDRYQPAK